VAEFKGVVAERLALVDAVDHLLNRGVVLTGETTLSLAGVDLVYLGLNLLVASVQTLEQGRPGSGGPPATGPAPARDDVATPPPPAPRAAPGQSRPPLSPPVTEWYARPQSGPEPPAPGPTDPAVYSLGGLPEHLGGPEDRPERGLARLVLALVEVLRQILERQAVRRMEGGALADDAVERMGLALQELEAKMAELRAAFDLGEDDLNLDLGPLGRLLE
jgi:hypothetical protein